MNIHYIWRMQTRPCFKAGLHSPYFRKMSTYLILRSSSKKYSLSKFKSPYQLFTVPYNWNFPYLSPILRLCSRLWCHIYCKTAEMFPRNIVRLGITMITSHSDDYIILISCVSGKILGCKKQKLILGNLNRKTFIGYIMGSQNLQMMKSQT